MRRRERSTLCSSYAAEGSILNTLRPPPCALSRLTVQARLSKSLSAHTLVSAAGQSSVRQQLRRPPIPISLIGIRSLRWASSVVVEVHPGCYLACCNDATQPRSGGDIRKCSITVIPQQRMAQRRSPRHSGHIDTQPTVVVEVRSHDVQAAHLV